MRTDEDENRVVLHVLVMRVLYELWELCSAISAANAILMYASELMLGQVMKLANVFEYFCLNASLFIARQEFRIFPICTFSSNYIFLRFTSENSLFRIHRRITIVSLTVGGNRVAAQAEAK